MSNQNKNKLVLQKMETLKKFLNLQTNSQNQLKRSSLRKRKSKNNKNLRSLCLMKIFLGVLT